MANRKIVAVIILAAMVLSMLPAVVPVNAVLTLTGSNLYAKDETTVDLTGQKGDVVSVQGTGVPSGYTVEIYWDDVTVTTWDGTKGKLNSTTAKSDGSYKVRFKVPSAVRGNHYVWVKAPQTSDAPVVSNAFDVQPLISRSSSSGVTGDLITVSFYGFPKEKDIRWYLAKAGGFADSVAPAGIVPQNIGTGTSVNAVLTYTATLALYPVKPGTVSLTFNQAAAGNVVVTDNSAGAFAAADVDLGGGVLSLAGTINYSTGAISITYGANPGATCTQVITAYTVVPYMRYGTLPEALGTAAIAGATSYTYTLAGKNAWPGTVTVTVAGTAIGATDDGVGGFPSTAVGIINVSGTINYANGEIKITYASAPTAADAIVATTYAYLPYDNDIVMHGAAAPHQYIDYGTIKTDALGAASSSFTVPTNPKTAGAAEIIPYAYALTALHAKGFIAGAVPVRTFTKGASISVSPSSGAVGDLVRVNGRGFIVGGNIIAATGIQIRRKSAAMALTPMIPNFPTAWGAVNLVVAADGSWYADVNVPQGNKAKDDYELFVTTSNAGDGNPLCDFTVTAIADVQTSVDSSSPGASVTVNGVNYINVADKTVTVDLVTTATPPVLVITMGTVKTSGDGSWSKVFAVPANTGSYKIRATDSTGISDTHNFVIGNIGVMMTPTHANAGSQVTLSGYGFTNGGRYNVTFGTKVLVKSSESVSLTSTSLTYAFRVPQLDAGTYTIKVWDAGSSISVSTTFTIDKATTASFNYAAEPNLYKVKIDGYGFYSVGAGNTTVAFKLYNKTSTGAMAKWFNIDVKDRRGAGAATCSINATGYIRGTWVVSPKTTISKGAYFLEVKDAQGYIVTIPFTVTDSYAKVEPRKTVFRPGETLSFTIEHSLGGQAAQALPIKGPYFATTHLRIYNPAGAEVFRTDVGAFRWVTTKDYAVVTYASEVASGNPMLLADDAPTGTWTWKWYDADPAGPYVAKSGSFEVSTTGGTVDPAVAALQTDIAGLKTSIASIVTSITASDTIVTTQMTALKTDISAVKTDVAGVKTAVSAEVAALKTDISAIKTDVAGVTTAVKADVAAVKTALTTSITSVQTDVGTVKTNLAATQAAVDATSKAVASLATSVAALNTAVGAAKTAADNANSGVGSLQTLVYGAIGASLIAAAAAIVALMQISRKIA